MMTEPEAWREIARRIVEGNWFKVGLCYEVWQSCDAGSINGTTWLSMYKRVALHLLGVSGGYAYPRGTEPEARALAALWLALEAEEDA